MSATKNKTSARTRKRPKPTLSASGRDHKLTSARTTSEPKPSGHASGREDGVAPANGRAQSSVVAQEPPNFSLSATIGDLLEHTSEPDPHRIAEQLMPRLPDEVRDHLVLAGLISHIRGHVRFSRSEGMRSQGPSKWASARQRVCPGGEWKLLEDCDASDLLALAEQHAAIAAENEQRECAYRALAAALKQSGCRTVGEMWAREGLAA